MFWIGSICAILLIIIICLLLKIYIMRRSTDEIRQGIAQQQEHDTNILISVSTNDRKMRGLADSMNKELRLLRKERRRFQSGNQELKEAVTNMAHDLRTPLTAICGYLDLLEKEQKSEQAEKYLAHIANRTEVLKQLTQELFQYSVIMSDVQELSTEMVNINGVLEESIADFYAVLTARGITPVIHMTSERIIRNLNRDALARVFDNILNNALKYSDGDLDISLLDSGEIIFTNTAESLSEVQVGKLFDRFFSVEAARNATGLGLSISKVLVEQMNGTITANYKGGRLSIWVKFNKMSKSN